MAFLRRRTTREADATTTAPLVPTYREQPLRLIVLFERLPAFDAARLGRALREVDARLTDARAEIITEALEGTTHGHAGWGTDEVIHVDGSSQPPEAHVLDAILKHATLLDDRTTQRARAARGQVVLTYVGRTEAPEVRFLALAVVAAALASLPGAIAVGDRSSHNTIAAAELKRVAATGLAGLRELPRLALAVGFDVVTISGWRGVWLRTFGAAQFGLPDLAYHSADGEDLPRVRTMFTAVHDYLKASGATIRAGDHLEAGDKRMTVRDPRTAEGWLRSSDPLLVLEDRVGPTS
jgi:hypothetical protein